MKNFKTLSLLTLLSLIFAFVFAFIPTNSVKASQSDFDCEYSACAQNEISVNVPHYGCSSVTTYTFDQAVSANIPEGFTDSVIAVENSSATSKGVVLDFTSKNIPVSIVKSISVRVYAYDDGVAGNIYPELRIPLPGSVGSWTIRYVIGDNTGKWVDFEIVEGEGEGYKCNFDNLSTDGKLGAFELAVRNDNTRNPFYIDYIKVNLYEDDGKAPVLTYDGKDEVVIPYGRPLNFAVSAHDEIEGEIAVEYVWGDESLLDENGLPQKGNHTLTFKATDYFGNTSTKTISVTVEDPDDEAPVINCNLPSIIYVKEGVIPQFSFTATDNREGEIVATVTWSNGALNGKGQLVKGWHHFIVKATDGSGNESSIRINVIVNETGEECDNVIDESLLFPRDPDEEESESESESVSESESESESESVKESESESESVSVKESVSEPESESESESVKESENESVSASESQSESLPQEEGCGGCGGCGANSSEETEGGCGGLINASALLTILLVAGAFIIRKKSND